MRLDAYVVGPRAIALRAAIGITGDDAESRTCWIDMAGPGVWKGHPAGPFELTPEVFKHCIANFEAQQNPLLVDYDHASLSVNPDGGAPAAGWLQKLELRGDRLWGLVEWCADCAAQIRAGKFRFCSPVFTFGEPDRKTGGDTVSAIDSVAVTNRPFLDGQTPIALTRDLQTELPHMDEDKTQDAGMMLAARLMEATGISDPAALMAALDANLEAVVKALKPAAAASDAPPEPKKDEPTAASVAAPASAPLIAPSPSSMAERVAALEAQVRGQSAELDQHRREAASRADAALVGEVEAAVACGKVAPAAKDAMVALARRAPAEWRALASSLPTVTPVGPSTAPAIAGPSQSLSLDIEAKRVALTKELKAFGQLTDAQIKATVDRRLEEGN